MSKLFNKVADTAKHIAMSPTFNRAAGAISLVLGANYALAAIATVATGGGILPAVIGGALAVLLFSVGSDYLDRANRFSAMKTRPA